MDFSCTGPLECPRALIERASRGRNIIHKEEDPAPDGQPVNDLEGLPYILAPLITVKTRLG